MFNASCSLALQLERCWVPVNSFLLHLPYHHDTTTNLSVLRQWNELCVLLVNQASTPLALTSLIFLTFFSSTFLVTKLLWSLHQGKVCRERNVHGHDIFSAHEHDWYYIRDEHLGEEDLVADVLGGDTLLFLSGKATLEVVEEEEDSQGFECCCPQDQSSVDWEVAADGPEREQASLRLFMTGEEYLSEEKQTDIMNLVDIPIEEMSTPTDFHSPLSPIVEEDEDEDDVDADVDIVIVSEEDEDEDADEQVGDGDMKEEQEEQRNDHHLQAEAADGNQHNNDFYVLPESKLPTPNKLHRVEEEENKNLSEHGVVFVIDQSQLEVKGSTCLQPKKVQIAEDNFPDSCTNGSTSKSSSEWRRSINCRDCETDGFFSSSSRRSSANWESYTVYRKYDEEMMFFDRISSQKLRETEALRSIKYQPRSMSERIFRPFATKKNQYSYANPYEELEAAYVAQICLAWEALNWNYSNFRRAIANRRKEDTGCPARVAQQFQEFHVLLQRFIETEPYEYGRRPEVYARIRTYSPKLLQVPEYHDDGELKEDLSSSRIKSLEFIKLVEDVIKTFMEFLQGDRKKCWEAFREIVRKRSSRSSSIDPRFVNMIKKAQNKKKLRLKELMRRRRCFRKRKLREEDEMDILMGLIDLKVVSRVLRMPSINEHQVQWCQEKLSRVSFLNGKVQRDSTPLFFPAAVQIL